MAISWKCAGRTIVTLTLTATLMLIITGCAVTVQPGYLWLGAQPTWAENKQLPKCSNTQSMSWYGKTTTSSDSWSCSQVYDLGDQRCVRSWTEYRSSYNAPGRANDSSSFTQYNSEPSCRPMTAAELAERDERYRRAAAAARAASTTKK